MNAEDQFKDEVAAFFQSGVVRFGLDATCRMFRAAAARKRHRRLRRGAPPKTVYADWRFWQAMDEANGVLAKAARALEDDPDKRGALTKTIRRHIDRTTTYHYPSWGWEGGPKFAMPRRDPEQVKLALVILHKLLDETPPSPDTNSPK